MIPEKLIDIDPLKVELSPSMLFAEVPVSMSYDLPLVEIPV